MLPEQLRLKLGGLDQEQLRIYEDFANPREPGQYQDASRAHFDGESAMDDLGLAHNAAARGTLAVPEATERLNVSTFAGSPVPPRLTPCQAIVTEIERVTNGLTYEGLAQVPEDHELRGLLAQVPDIIAECSAREQATMVCAQKLVAMLFRCSSAVARDVFVSLLAHVCGLSVKVAHEVTSWLVFAEDDVRPHLPTAKGRR